MQPFLQRSFRSEAKNKNGGARSHGSPSIRHWRAGRRTACRTLLSQRSSFALYRSPSPALHNNVNLFFGGAPLPFFTHLLSRLSRHLFLSLLPSLSALETSFFGVPLGSPSRLRRTPRASSRIFRRRHSFGAQSTSQSVSQSNAPTSRTVTRDGVSAACRGCAERGCNGVRHCDLVLDSFGRLVLACVEGPAEPSLCAGRRVVVSDDRCRCTKDCPVQPWTGFGFGDWRGLVTGSDSGNTLTPTRGRSVSYLFPLHAFI